MKVEIHETIDSPWGPLHCVASAEQPVIATVVGTDNPYPPDVLAAIPWARDAGLRLVQGREQSGDSWLYVTDNFFYTPTSPEYGWWQRTYSKDQKFFGYYPTREAALKSPPPKPPGYVEPKAARPASESLEELGIKPTCTTLDKLSEVAFETMFQNLWYMDQTSSRKRDWRQVAQAVRLAVLEEPWAEEDEMAAFAEYTRRPMHETVKASMKHALSAALASRVARARKEGGGNE